MYLFKSVCKSICYNMDESMYDENKYVRGNVLTWDRKYKGGDIFSPHNEKLKEYKYSFESV